MPAGLPTDARNRASEGLGGMVAPTCVALAVTV